MKRSSSRSEFVRFLVAGGTNAVVTYLIYLAALPFTGYAIAYTVSYLLGIAFSYVANSKAVFGTAMNARSAARFPLVYVFQYAVGMLLMWLQVDVLGIPAWLAPWIATALLTPLSFLLTRKLLRAS